MSPEPRHRGGGRARGVPCPRRRTAREGYESSLHRPGGPCVVMRASARLRSSALPLALFVLVSALSPVGPSTAFAGDPFADLDLIRPRQPSPAPEFTIPRLGSGSLSLRELRGHLIFLNFWATWCPPCKEEMPSMERLYQRYKGRGFTIVAISIDSGG